MFTQCKMEKKTDDLLIWFLEMECIRRRIKETGGQEKPDEELISHVLMNVPSSYERLVTTLRIGDQHGATRSRSFAITGTTTFGQRKDTKDKTSLIMSMQREHQRKTERRTRSSAIIAANQVTSPTNVTARMKDKKKKTTNGKPNQGATENVSNAAEKDILPMTVMQASQSRDTCHIRTNVATLHTSRWHPQAKLIKLKKWVPVTSAGQLALQGRSVETVVQQAIFITLGCARSPDMKKRWIKMTTVYVWCARNAARY